MAAKSWALIYAIGTRVQEILRPRAARHLVRATIVESPAKAIRSERRSPCQSRSLRCGVSKHRVWVCRDVARTGTCPSDLVRHSHKCLCGAIPQSRRCKAAAECGQGSAECGSSAPLGVRGRPRSEECFSMVKSLGYTRDIDLPV